MKDQPHFLNTLIDILPTGIIAVNKLGEIVMMNQKAANMLGISSDISMVKGKRLYSFIAEHPKWSENLERVLKENLETFHFTTSTLYKRFYRLEGHWIEDDFVMFMEDITKTKTIEKQTLHAILQGQEQERRRIAQEIHDGLGPLFSSLTMHIESLEEIIEEKTPDFIFQCSILRELSKTIAQDIRSISHDLMPSAVEDFGLATALENLCKSTNEVSKSEINFYAANLTERLDKNVELGLYRIGQELLNNALKYAKAESIVIQLIKHDDSIVLMVEDDGVGFDKQLMSEMKKGIGWRNISMRTKSLGGVFTIDAQIGDGVLGTVEIPLKK